MLSLRGEYASIGRFLEAVEEFDVIARIAEITFQKKNDDDKILRADVTIKLYDLHELVLK